MGTLSSLGIALSIVFTFLFLALIAEVYYLLWWKNRTTSITATKQLFALFCFFKKQPPSSLASTPSDILNSVRIADESDNSLFKREDSIEEEGIEAELIRLHNLPGFPRLLFTIQEETKEDMESDDGKSRYERSRKGSRGKSLSELFLSGDTPFLTPLASPPVTPLRNYNPLFELKATSTLIGASPPPKFKFLRDAEEKLYRKTLTEEAMKVHMKGSVVLPVHSDAQHSSNSESKESQLDPKLEKEEEEEKGSLIKIVIGHHHHHHPSQCSSQVTPLPSSPTIKNSEELSDSTSRA